jgi:hypothetical protein
MSIFVNTEGYLATNGVNLATGEASFQWFPAASGDFRRLPAHFAAKLRAQPRAPTPLALMKRRRGEGKNRRKDAEKTRMGMMRRGEAKQR